MGREGSGGREEEVGKGRQVMQAEENETYVRKVKADGLEIRRVKERESEGGRGGGEELIAEGERKGGSERGEREAGGWNNDERGREKRHPPQCECLVKGRSLVEEGGGRGGEREGGK